MKPVQVVGLVVALFVAACAYAYVVPEPLPPDPPVGLVNPAGEGEAVTDELYLFTQPAPVDPPADAAK